VVVAEVLVEVAVLVVVRERSTVACQNPVR